MAWLFLPFYGALLNEVLPSEWSQFDDAFDIAVLVACFAGVWSGAKGGPFMITRAVILHELGSPVSKRRLLLPWLIRQAAAWAMAGAVVTTVLIVLADQSSFGYEVALSTSVAAIFAAWCAVFLAAATLVATHQPAKATLIGAGVAAVVVGVAIAVAIGTSMRSWTGIAVLAAAAVASSVIAIGALEFTPAEPLWKRATAVESMRSSLQQFQFQRVLVDLRNATEQPPSSTGSRLAWPGLPLAAWRHAAAIQHGPLWHLLRLLGFSAALAALFWWGEPDQGIVALAMAACAFLIGIEVSGAVAATADQMTFIVHYPRGSGRVLRSQVATSLLIALILGLCAVVGGIGPEPRASVGTLVICAAGALAATVQARLGSPDTAALLDKFGPEMLGGILWARALLGPLLLLGITVTAYHQFLAPEPLANSLYGLVVVLITAAFIISTDPLERAIERRKG